MKKEKFFAVLLTMSFILAAPAFAAPEVKAKPEEGVLKYGFVDVAKIFDEYQKTKENDRVLQEAGKKKEEERDSFVREIRQMKDELALLADDAKAKKQDSLSKKIKELQDFDADTRQALGEQRNGVVREIFKDIDTTVQAIGQKKGLDFVFNDRALLYRNPKFDMTREVTDTLNKGYSPKKAGKKK